MKNYRWDHWPCNAPISACRPADRRPDGMITVDPSDFAKKGQGIGRRGPAILRRPGKDENCQSGVFVGYSSDKGYGLLTCRLYMPQKLVFRRAATKTQSQSGSRRPCFQTKQQIALELINEVGPGHFPAKWIGADATFGSDIEFLNALPKDFITLSPSDPIPWFLQRNQSLVLPPYKGRGRRPSKVESIARTTQAAKVSEIARSGRLT